MCKFDPRTYSIKIQVAKDPMVDFAGSSGMGNIGVNQLSSFNITGPSLVVGNNEEIKLEDETNMLINNNELTLGMIKIVFCMVWLSPSNYAMFSKENPSRYANTQNRLYDPLVLPTNVSPMGLDSDYFHPDSFSQNPLDDPILENDSTDILRNVVAKENELFDKDWQNDYLISAIDAAISLRNLLLF
ncbi:unnamed protein product [Lepeophtheirus salmonis]|uniref:(salmon louse) hypothetical protein n=1 Tax=Lepeophtheirus salmonis TaxID=72036 RepID=A0A7R8CGQ8_LEPSM|nr:unnamed protein product [Lepeophtheirus salmonis]CAF2760631.1 unnamed protein product [Lepeophtheirus salmonis]